LFRPDKEAARFFVFSLAAASSAFALAVLSASFCAYVA